MPNNVLAITGGQITGGSINLGYDPGTGTDRLREYSPSAPSLSEGQFINETLQSGAELAYSTMRNITETALVKLKEGSFVLNQEKAQDIEQAFEDAKRYALTGKGNPVYLRFDPNNTGDLYRSQILSGQVIPTPNILGDQMRANEAQVQLSLTRRFFWEAETEGTAIAGSVVHNCNAGGTINYVNVVGGSVSGILPTPIRLEIQNLNAALLENVLVGHNAWYSPTDLDHWLEGEDQLGGTTVISTTCSGGAYQSIGLGTAEATLFDWTISATNAR